MLGRTLAAAVAALVLVPAAARAQAGAVVALGDSAISGEAGRWAGNTNGSPSRTDALGPAAYWDTPTGEAIPGCHRSKSAEVGPDGVNLACSGARTATRWDGPAFKPGIDFYDDGAGHIGQALALQRYAARHAVRAVVVLVGANDYGFPDIVAACVTDWLTSPSWWRDYCQDDGSIAPRFTPSSVAARTAAVRGAYVSVQTAMRRAGHAPGSYRLFAQTYASPLPRGAGNRYPQTGFTRQSIGGCGVWDKDADWSNDTVVATFNQTTRDAVAALPGISLLDMTHALDGRRLCEDTVGLLEEQDVPSWRSAGAVDRTEWVQQIRTLTAVLAPYQLQEDGHPDYWGQLGLRNCLRQALAAAGTSLSCVRASGLNAHGEPNMTLG